ncbi:MAG TPA: GtrA family protein [Pseudorhodoplanes sp.]|jgi:putative flippase GtrA|nr:GtrA family protein [Pseudorhodoplanes sp.]
MNDMPSQSLAARGLAFARKQAFLLKAASFAAIGVVNALVDLGVFLLTLRSLGSLSGILVAVTWLSQVTGFSVGDIALVVANGVAWVVAVTGSYVMNSFVTFAKESGRKLTWRAYLTFAASGVLGWLANTATVLVASRFLPVVAAKVLAIGVGFIVNFSMSHFVVFRPK